MATFRKAWILFAMVFVGCGSARGAANEYYSSAAAKGIVDEMIRAYGGTEKLKSMERAKIVMEVKEGAMTFKATLYQAPGKARMDMDMIAPQRGMSAVSIYDGKKFSYLLNGKPGTAPPNAKDTLEYGVKEGIFQASVLHTFLTKEHELIYRGKKKYDGKEYDLIETKDGRAWNQEHYIDPQTHRKMVTVTKHDRGGFTHVVEAFDEYEGVLYPKRMLVKAADGSARGSMRVLEVSKDFGDNVFVAPK